MKFTEAQLESAIIELLGVEGYPHVLGDAIERQPQEVLIKADLRAFLAKQYAADHITPQEIDAVINQLEAYSAADLYESIAENYPSVTQRRVHLPGRQYVIFTEGHAEATAAQPPLPTELDGFFAYNAAHPDCNTTYVDFPQRFTWKPDQREWQQRLQTIEATLVRLIGRKLNDAKVQLGHLQQRLKHPGAQLREQSQRLDELEQRLILAQKNLLRRRAGELALLESRLRAHSPLPYLRQQQLDLQRHRQRLNAAIQQKLQHAGEHGREGPVLHRGLRQLGV